MSADQTREDNRGRLARFNCNPDDGFLMLPHGLLKRVLAAGLSGAEWITLILCIMWTLGYNKFTCTAGLSAIVRCSSLTKWQASRALKGLLAKGLLTQVKPSSYRRSAEYAVNFECSIPATVAPERPSEAKRRFEQGLGVAPERPGCSADATGESLKRYRGVAPERPYIESNIDIPSIESFQRTPLGSQKAQTEAPPPFSEPLKEKPKPKHPFSEESLNSLIEIFQAIDGRSVWLSKTERREVRIKWQSWAADSNFVTVFQKRLLKYRASGRNEQAPIREADVFMSIVRSMRP